MRRKLKHFPNFKFKSYETPAPRNLRCPSELKQLRKRCLASIRDFHTEGEVVGTQDGVYIYCDNGANILAVAHLDTVLSGPRHFGSPKGKADKVYNAQLDDRLGAYIILDVLPAMGIKVDTLLTVGEESCRSTAAHFQSDKKYNWLVEFDRAGEDVVLYDYWTAKLRKLLKKQGNEVGIGSYSDISVMEHLGVAGFNWGIGYHNHHYTNCYFSISEYQAAILRFLKFYNAYKDREFPHTPCEYFSDDETDPWGYYREWTEVGKGEYYRESTGELLSAATRREEREILFAAAREEEERILWEEEEFRRDWSEYKAAHEEAEQMDRLERQWADACPSRP